MKGFTLTRSFDDAEIYTNDNLHIIFVWGWATGSDTGQHNHFNTDVLVARWIGEQCDPYELPTIQDDRWESILGFDVKGDENGYNWDNYEEQVKIVLSEMKYE